MAFFGKILAKGALASVMVAGLALGGCETGGLDLQVDAPVLDAVGLNLSSKPKKETDLPERPGLVMPPSNAAMTLPEPGERTSANSQNWPADPDLLKKQKEEEETAAREKYCREGDWSGKGGITEFEKNTGRQARCSSKIGDAISKSVGGGAATAR
jgi:hypothetical protein